MVYLRGIRAAREDPAPMRGCAQAKSGRPKRRPASAEPQMSAAPSCASSPDCTPATPVKPARPSRAISPAASPRLSDSTRLFLADTMRGWRANMVALQPLVQVGDAVLVGAAALLDALVGARPDLAPALCDGPAALLTYAAAAVWAAAKLAGVRTAIPNRTLMARAAGVHAAALSDFELDLCQSLRWDVAAVMRAAGAL